jgi:aspartate beta-hydroxylase
LNVAAAVRREDVERSLAAGDVAAALAGSAALLEADASNVDALTLRASALLADKRPEAALALLQQAVADGVSAYAVRAALAMCQVSAGDQRGALPTFADALSERPGDFILRLAHAETLDMLGERDDALPQYFRAVHDAQQYGRWLSDATTGPAIRDRVRRAMDIIDSGRSALFERVLQPHVAAHGAASMARVMQGLRIYLKTQAPPAGDPRQRPKFLWLPGLPATPIFPRERFDWYEALEAAAPAIREELAAVLDGSQALTPFLQIDDASAEEDYLGGDPAQRAWDAFFFHRHGVRHADSHTACPRTSRALESVPLTRIAEHAPEVLFSVLAPQTHIKPHHGVTNTRVVTHLPLLIPQGDCALVVGGEVHRWQPDRCVTFDDTFLHEAWNRSGERRVVLILDTWHPDLQPEECLALKDLVEQLGHFNTRAGIA